MALSNPCVQYKSTKFGFGSHFQQAQGNAGGLLGSKTVMRSFSEAAERPYKVHPRGYNDYTDVHYHIFHEINAAMQACHNCPDYAYVFNKYSDYLTDF